jgi:hypothetical protein
VVGRGAHWLECASEDAALDMVRDLMVDSDGWTEIPIG